MNKKHLIAKNKTSLPLLLASLLTFACGDKTPPEDIVKQRVIDRWAIRINGKIDGLYEYLSPAQKQILGRVAYERSFGSVIKYLGADVKSVNCVGEKPSDYEVCHVDVYIKFETRGAHKTQAGSLLSETWVKEDNQWWLAHK